MKFAVTTTLLFATLAFTNPAPVAQPEADGALASRSVKIEKRDQLSEVLAARNAAPVSKVAGRTAGVVIPKPTTPDVPSPPKSPSQKPKKPEEGGDGGDGSDGSGGNSTEGGAAAIMIPSRALELGALGLGIIQVMNLWG